MTTPEDEFVLSKKEDKIFSSIIKFGGQTKQELNFATDLQADKIDSGLLTLLNKKLIKLDEQTGIYYPVLPFEKLLNMLENYSTSLDTGKNDQINSLQQYKQSIEEVIVKFRETLEKQIEGFKLSSNKLQESLKDILETRDNEHIQKAEEITDEIVSSFSSSMSQTNSTIQTIVSTETGKFEKKWSDALTGLRNIPEAGERNLKKSISSYEEEISKTIGVVSDKITMLHTQLSDIITTIQAETNSQVQEFFSNTGTAANEFKSNLSTGLSESRKQEKEFINEIRLQIQVKFVENITNILETIVKEFSNEIDKRIEEALIRIRQQTELAIKETSTQIKSTFKGFAENAEELLREQQSFLDVLNTELTEISSEQKLERNLNTFIQQLQTHLATDLSTLETNYLQVQKSVIEIMEEIRRSARNKLIQQNSEIENIIGLLTSAIEKNLSRKDMDVVHLQQLSQSIEQLLRNLLVSIPMRSNHIKASIKDSIENSANEIQGVSLKVSQEALNNINKTLDSSQKRIETNFQETLEECDNEIQKVVNASEQMNTTITNLQNSYQETIQSRFEQRAKVMNTELEAVARNFQQIMNSIESGVKDVNESITSDTGLINIDSTIQSSVTQLKNEIDTIFSQSQTYSRDFVNQLDSNLQNHLDRTLDIIKEGFNQLKTGFNQELENQLSQINDKNTQQQEKLVAAIDEFYNQSTEKFVDFRTNLAKSIEENQNSISEFISESRRGTEEVINVHKTNIVKYLEKGPADIFSFIKQVEAEVSAQNKNLKDALEELTSYYKGFSDSALGEISGMLHEVHETGDKLSNTFNDSLQSLSSTLSKANDNIEIYFSDSMTELENQISVSAGFITSEVARAVDMIQEEIKSLKDEMKKSIDVITDDMKTLITKQDQDFQDTLPEMNKEFTNMFNDLIQNRSRINNELEQNAGTIISNLITNWNKQMESTKTSLQDITKAISEAIKANIKNFEVIVETNVEQVINRINTIYGSDSSFEDTIGVKEISETIKRTNKRLKSSISENLKSHIDNFNQQLPELLTSYEAIHTQIEEDLSSYLEDLGDLISSSQTELTKQIHNYLKEERDLMDFSELKEELNTIIRNFSQATTKSVETLSKDLLDTVQITFKEVDQAKIEIQGLFNSLSESIGKQNSELLNNLEKIKDVLMKSTHDMKESSHKDMKSHFESYNGDLEKVGLELTRESSQLAQSVHEDIESKTTTVIEQFKALFNEFLSSNDQYRKLLQDMSSLMSQTKPLETVRLINLPSDENKNSFLIDMINKASKQVTIFTSNPTLISVSDLKTIPSKKRVWIFTNFDFSKKGKKWFSEVNEQVNINLRKAKVAKLTGFLAIRDEDYALVLPDNLGFTTFDSRFITYLSSLLSIIKGPAFGKTIE